MKYQKQLAFCAALLTGLRAVPAAPVTVTAAMAAADSGTCGENLTWEFDAATGTVTISGEGPMEDYQYADLCPWAGVRDSIRAVVFQEGVTTVGDYAFAYCENVHTITFADSITGLRHCAFSQCKALESLELPPHITSLPMRAFAFCENITSVVIPEGVTSIGNEAFEGCMKLTDVSIPESVETVGAWAFYITPWQNAKIKENPLVTVNHILIDGMKVQGDVVVPEDIVSISAWAFYTALQLETLTILNPECSIYDNRNTICNASLEDGDLFQYYFSGTIRGYEGSTAQAYAEKYGITFESLGEAPQNEKLETTLLGDVDCSEVVDVSDAVLLARYLTEDKSAEVPDQGLANADADGSGTVDADDVIRIVRMVAKLA